VGVTRIQIVSTPEKLQALRGQPLWVDTGDSILDSELRGYFQVIVGNKEYVVYRVTM
jgi:predicted polyphosphate/ATP-dependent NAD kinase